MNWDHPVHSFNYPNGEPQTPTRTPTSTAFGESAFQTPKIESSFYDPRVTWDTADPYASSPEFLKTPQRFVFSTPSNSLHRQSSHLEQATAEELYGQHVPGVDVARITEGTDTAKTLASGQNLCPGEEAPATVNSATCSAALMQTPPPTSTSRRKVAEYANNGSVQHFTESSRRPSVPGISTAHLQTPTRLVGASPHLFANLQNSPDLFQLSAVDPSSSPFFPQHKLFQELDPGQHVAVVDGLVDMYSDPFAAETNGTIFNPLSDTGPSLSVPSLPIIPGSMDLPEFSGGNKFNIGLATPAAPALFPAPFSTSPRVPAPKADDPTLFLSSPARRFGAPQPRLEPKPAVQETRQPYHHQTEESKREKLRRASNRLSKPLSFDEDDDDEDFAPAARGVKPGLGRSLSHTTATALPSGRQQSQQATLGTVTKTGGIKKPSSRGRSSPIKPQRHLHPCPNSLGFPTRSQSLVLKIDKDGRAKLMPESSTGLTGPVSEMDLDGSATENDSDPADYSEHPTAHSQNTSSAPPGPTLSKPQVARTGSVSRPHSKSSSHSSTVTSSTSGRRSPWAADSSRGGSSRSQAKAPSLDFVNTPRRFSIPPNPEFTHGTSSSAGDPPPGQDEDSGDAQHALRKVLKGRKRNSKQPQGSTYGPAQASTLQPPAHLPSSPPSYGNRFDISSGDSTTSPTTNTDIEISTPSTDRHSNPSNGTRCVCKSMDNGGHLMIQCESCNHWLHTKCVGLERANLPPVYICVYCAQTPMRGGRIRDPLAGAGHAPSSPLARKSFRYR
ncbi:hypothetical protein V8E54_011770 [Elaphomyces granulatus]